MYEGGYENELKAEKLKSSKLKQASSKTAARKRWRAAIQKRKRIKKG